MAVPKKKTSPSRRGMRQSADALKQPAYVEDKDSGLASGIYVLENPFNLRARTVFGGLSREVLEHALSSHPGTFQLLPLTGPDGQHLIAIAIPDPHEREKPIALLAIDMGDASFEQSAHIERIVQALTFSSAMHMDRIARIDEANFAAESAHALARIQLRVVNPSELCAAMAVALEELNKCSSIAGAAAIDLTKDKPVIAGAFGEIDLETALRAREDHAFAKSQRMHTQSIAVDGITEGLLAVRFAFGPEVADGDILAGIGAAVIGCATRFRATSTIDLLRRNTTRQLVEAQERDRATVAADIHDGTLQQLGATAMRLELIRARTAAGDVEAMDELIDRCAADIRSCTRELRNLLMELRPQVLDDNGLAAALAELGRAVEDTEVEVNVDVPDQIADDFAITVFRIVQEALNNIRKHARAKHAWVDVTSTPDAIRLVVRDDGVGFEGAASGPSSSGQHLGLLGMRERTRMMGGEFSIVGHSGGGTIVTVVLPTDTQRNQPPMIAA